VAPQLGRVANPFGAAVMSDGGFDSMTDKEKFARQLIDHDRPTDVLHIGDHDPSGATCFWPSLRPAGVHQGVWRAGDVEPTSRNSGTDRRHHAACQALCEEALLALVAVLRNPKTPSQVRVKGRRRAAQSRHRPARRSRLT
jgi:hypothetical protein